jgi:hypothetical protein
LRLPYHYILHQAARFFLQHYDDVTLSISPI